ncbi:MAG: sarcosine oxidase subunit gamma [Paracoccaceae bacterium]
MSEVVTALAGAVAEPRPRLRIADRGPVGMVTLRADLAEPRVAAAVRAVAGVEIPGVWSARFADEGRGAVWMAPDELLILVPYSLAGESAARLDADLAGLFATAVDVSDARTVLALSGPDVAETLAKGAPMDLSPDAFPPGAARRTHLAEIAIGLWRRSEAEWEIVTFRSVSRHLFDWLVASGAAGAEVHAF